MKICEFFGLIRRVKETRERENEGGTEGQEP